MSKELIGEQRAEVRRHLNQELANTCVEFMEKYGLGIEEILGSLEMVKFSFFADDAEEKE